VVFTSPERKAHETADLIVRALGLAPARAVRDLREHDDGGAPFTDEAAFRSLVADLFAHPSERVFGAESADEAHARFAAAIAALPRSEDGSSEIVVSHGRVLSLFIARHSGADAFEVWRKLTTPWFAVVDLG
jgi:broad specificity phosphatase PhoE